MIELNHIVKTYHHAGAPVYALKDINLSVAKGEIFGVIGKSGAGKSTLIRCVNLLEKPSAGTVKIDGQDLTIMTERQLRTMRRQVGMIFQHFNLLSSRTVYQNIAFPLELIGCNANEIENAVFPLLKLTGLEEKKDNYPAQLSGGQKQRVAIARALACKPKVLLCDEATSALDPHTTKTILELLKNINKQLQLTILLITHEMEVIKEIADQVAIIDHGEIIEQGSVIDLFTHPKTAIAKKFSKTCLKHELPETLQKKLLPTAAKNTHPVLRLLFQGDVASEPLISHLIQKIGLEINILQANIEFIKKNTIGIMVIEVMNNQEKLQSGIQFLQSKGLHVEVIGHVTSDIHGIA